MATKNSISYLEYGEVIRLGLPFASLQNQSGTFVRPEPKSFDAGLTTVKWDAAQGFGADTTNLAGENAYPMAVVTYAVIPKDRATGRINRVRDIDAERKSVNRQNILAKARIAKESREQPRDTGGMSPVPAE